MYKDFLGQEIKVGDIVVFTTFGGIQSLYKGTITKFHKNNGVSVRILKEGNYYNGKIRVTRIINLAKINV